MALSFQNLPSIDLSSKLEQKFTIVACDLEIYEVNFGLQNKPVK